MVKQSGLTLPPDSADSIFAAEFIAHGTPRRPRRPKEGTNTEATDQYFRCVHPGISCRTVELSFYIAPYSFQLKGSTSADKVVWPIPACSNRCHALPCGDNHVRA